MYKVRGTYAGSIWNMEKMQTDEKINLQQKYL